MSPNLSRFKRYTHSRQLAAHQIRSLMAFLRRHVGEKEAEGLPVTFRRIRTGRDKADFVRGLSSSGIASIGNGRNDVEMVRMSAVGMAVVGPEGCSGELVAAAKVVCRDILDALDLLLNPLRLKATLRD